MVSLKLQLILLAGSLICLVLLINFIRKYRLELKYSMLWFVVTIISVVLSIFPTILNGISHLMGIELPVNALFLLTFLGLIMIILSLTLELSKSTTKIKELSQEVGILKHEMEKIKEQMRKENP
ncbi:DUF2304 domain-containing protein [Paenibacillus bovis]|uniref:Glycosyl transferase n=1 Tax=Paenibacillus bovis TaxID=1616788 RepID=A0A172ZMI1_9BACL|nr:DUF2304 domain-containing protein [Paenibacillus bovis]ANF98437.1 hypothetical protein AR543_22235 [Paenibacillus bovis]